MFQVGPEGSLQVGSPLPAGTSVFYLLRPLTDWDENHPHTEGDLLYSECTDLNIVFKFI